MNSRKTIVPPIKCQGIKTKLVPLIQDVVGKDVDGTWIEPFMGSGVVAFNVQPKRAVLADTNPHIIRFYRSVADGSITPSVVREYLFQEGEKLSESDGTYYYDVRDRFNRLHSPLDFLFLNRSCFNGLMRFNRRGEFNVPFCRKPERFSRAYITKICNQIRAVRDAMKISDVNFLCQDLGETIRGASHGDLIYCDPPYIGRHTDYYNRWGSAEEYRMARLLIESDSRFVVSTWHSNRFRINEHLQEIWSDYNLVTKEHFYHLGGREINRNPIIEALVVNFEPQIRESEHHEDNGFQSLLMDGRRTMGAACGSTYRGT